uniref:VWFA domain-containing protein n=1 Tax=Ciona savignyi TaxID=51511 RepID=H2YJD5_CIOSA
MLRLFKSEKSVRRINHLCSILNKDHQHLTCSRHRHDGYVSIGNVQVPVKTPKNPELVPYAYVLENAELPQSALRHMKWMAQKDLLGQDVFLIGPPGPLRRVLAMQYLELTRKEVEYISLSRDTTESDLKQRREMRKGTSFYIDQCAVRAAVEGRVLIIEGVEKAERNVLPALNNLLENREMQLDDGRFLMHHKRYDQLLQDHSKETLDKWQLVRVSEDFRVFALGLPVPKYRGHPLDPPLRSRFQARDVYHLGFSVSINCWTIVIDYYEINKTSYFLVFLHTVLNFIIFYLQDKHEYLSSQLTCMLARATIQQKMFFNIIYVNNLSFQFPGYPIQNLLSRLYPYKLVLNKEGTQAVEDIYQKFELSSSSANSESLALHNINVKNNHKANVSLHNNNENHNFEVSCGDHTYGPRSSKDEFVATSYHQRLLADLMLSHGAMDMCIIGGKGCGKSSVLREFARLLSYRTEPVLMYQDMTARDLLQQRYTLPNGDTVWKISPLIEAALEGGMAVLDGLNRVNPAVYRIHPSFRMIGLAEPPTTGSSAQQWLNPELLTLFLYHHMEPLSVNNELEVIQKLHLAVMKDMLQDYNLGEHILIVGNQGVGKNKIVDRFLHLLNKPREYLQLHSCHAVDNPSVASELDMLRQYGANVPESSLKKLVAAFGELRDLADRGLISYPYSTREVVNIVKHLEKFPKEGLANVVRNVFDFDAYSKETKEQLSSVMHKHGIPIGAKPHDVRLAKPLPLSAPKLSGYWNILHQSSSYCDGPVHLTVQNYEIERTEDRGLDFSEQFAHWQLPQFFRTNIITDIASPEDDVPTKLTQIKEEGVDLGFGSFVTPINRILVDKDSYAKCVVGFPHLTATNEIYSFPRSNSSLEDSFIEKGRTIYRGLTKFVPPKPPCQILSSSNQVVKVVSLKTVPEKAFDQGTQPRMTSHCLEVADLGQHMLRYVPIPQAVAESPYVSWQSSISESGYHLARGRDDVLYTVDTGGCVREWETGLLNLQRSLAEWRAMIGSDDMEDKLQITTERESGEDVTAPKHGKIDPKNAPHVGGNTWAGGTGGRDTAGMGGKGGPYRLDMGHDVTQIPDWEKEAVPEHVKKAAREVAQKAFKERLREIRMSEFDADMYEKFSSHVRKQVNFKKLNYAHLEQPGTPQQKPKRIRVVMDVSGSMYRFNGLDNRLERTVEAACLVMESFEGYKEKFKYELWGHSGDGFDIPLVTYEKPPTNNKERLEVMKTMHAHAQFCMSGDHTLEAAEYAVKNIKEQEADEYFVVVLSDANLERYGIRPMQFAEVLTSDDEVNAFVIFIGSLGDQAERLKKQLPLGRSFVCMDTKNIPQILQQIFTSSLL